MTNREKLLSIIDRLDLDKVGALLRGDLRTQVSRLRKKKMTYENQKQIKSDIEEKEGMIASLLETFPEKYDK